MVTFAQVSMFKCQQCGSLVPRGVAASRIVLETRPVRYPARREANREIVIHNKRVKPDDPGGNGHETVREIMVCPDCAGSG